MPRTISAALATELAKTVTSIGYLVQINTTTPRRWSNIGQISWNSQTWLDNDFSIDGLSFDIDAELTASLKIQNLANLNGESQRAGQLFLSSSEKMYDISVVIYQFERDALAVADVPKIATMSINDARFTDEMVILSLLEHSSATGFSPRRRINAANGFDYAVPDGTVIRWGNEILTVEVGDG